MSLTAPDLKHLKAEGWEAGHIDWAVAQGLRSIDESEAAALNIGCNSKDGFVNPTGLFFPYGISEWEDSEGIQHAEPYGQLRCHQTILRPNGKPAPKYLPTIGVRPIVWTPPEPLAITEGWKDGAAPFIRHEIPVGAIGAPSYFRCMDGVHPEAPLLLDPDTPFVLEVWRILVSCGLEQDRRIGHLPWMDEFPKGGFTEFCFANQASQTDVMNVVGSAARAKDYLFRLAEAWANATDDQWRAANKGAEQSRVPFIKARNAEQLAKTAARCLSVSEAGALFGVIYKKLGIKKSDLEKTFAAKQAAANREKREAARRNRRESGKPIYSVDSDTTLEACVIHNLHATHGQMVSRNLQFWRWSDDAHHWERKSGHDVKHWLSKDLENYQEPPASDRDLPRYKFSTLENIKRVSGYLQIRLDDQRLDGSPHLIPFTNGALDVTTGELLPHSPDYGCTYCIQGDYILRDRYTATAPAFAHLLATSYAKAHHQMLRAGLRMIIDPTMPSGKALVLEGATGSGKGALVNGVIRRLFPVHAVTALQNLDQLNGKEAIYQSVLGKRLITFGDLLGRQSKYSAFYELVDQSMVTARRLFESEEVTVDFAGRFVLAMTRMPIFVDDDGNTGWMRRAFVVPTIPGERDCSLYDGDLEADLAKEVGTIASWALAMDRKKAIDILQGRSADEEVQRVQAAAAATTDSLSEFVDHCLVPTEGTTEPHQIDLIDAYRLFCHTTNKKPLADQRFTGQLRKALPHLNQQRRQLSRDAAREQGIDENNRWLPARFFGFELDEEVWRRDATDVLPLKEYPSFDVRTGVDWEMTLSNWEEHGLSFQWNRDSKRASTGFIHRTGLAEASGRLLQLRQHRPQPNGE